MLQEEVLPYAEQLVDTEGDMPRLHKVVAVILNRLITP